MKDLNALPLLIDKTIGENLCALRELAQISQQSAADYLMISVDDLIAAEKGTGALTVRQLAMLKFFYGVTDYNSFFEGLF